MKLFKVRQEHWDDLQLEYGTLPYCTESKCDYIAAPTMQDAIAKVTLVPGFILSDVTMERYFIPREEV